MSFISDNTDVLINFSRPNQESQVIKKANGPLDHEQMKTKVNLQNDHPHPGLISIFFYFYVVLHLFLQLTGFGFGLLSGVDPNEGNFVGAGVVHTVGQQIGCLLRLEPNKQVQVRISLSYLLSFFALISSSSCYFLRCTGWLWERAKMGLQKDWQNCSRLNFDPPALIWMLLESR